MRDQRGRRRKVVEGRKGGEKDMRRERYKK
jgi:hypothetical protein